MIICLLLPIHVNADIQTYFLAVPPNAAVPIIVPLASPVGPAKPIAKKSPVKRYDPDPFAPGKYGGTCVNFAKAFLGLSGTWGYGGKYLPHNTTAPVVHDVVIFSGHVAVVIGISADGTLTLIESNLHLDGRITMGRQINESSSTIRGFYHPV